MGGLTYLFGFVVNGVVATVLAGLAAVLVASLPVRRMVEEVSSEPTSRKSRAIIAFICVWLLVMLYGCVEMFRTHHDEMTKSEGSRIILGLIESEAQVLRAERIAHGDSAQSYLMVLTTAEAVEQTARIQKMKPAAYEGHTVRDRGWPAPDWWPTTNCKGGVTYHADPFDAPPADLGYTLNWCPAEKKVYVQRFDY